MWFRAWTLVAVITVAFAFAGGASACVGARPLAMGGAFVGLADDVNATYWNPAGLVQLKDTEATVMHTVTNRDEINYKNYIAVAGRMGKTGAIGASWVKIDFILGETQDWYWASLATKLGKAASLGVNVRFTHDSAPGFDTDTALDVALFGKVSPKLSLGLLIQNINTPETSDGVISTTWIRNWRPGLAFRPDKTSVVSMELYDAANEGDMQALRVGYEKLLKRGWAIRTGWYEIGQEEASSFTIGFGKTNMGEKDDEVKSSSFDVAAMIGEVDTIIASASFKF